MTVDDGFLSWVASKTNGANVHDSNMLRCNYTWYCSHNDETMAKMTQELLTAFLNSGKGRVRDLIGRTDRSLFNQFTIWKKENENGGK